jgi:signal transduction histidine kinase
MSTADVVGRRQSPSLRTDASLCGPSYDVTMKTIATLRSVAANARHARPPVTDAVLAVSIALAVAVVILADLEGTGRASLPAYLFAAGFGALLLVRRRYPLAVLVLTVLGIFTYYAIGFPPIGISLPAVAAMYSAAEQDRTGEAVTAGAVLVAVSAYFRISEGLPQSYLISYELVTNIALIAAGIALGVVVRMRRETRLQQDRLNALAAAERVRHAEGLVHAERMRMARDLHDVIGHTMSVISLHSNVAAEAIGHDDGAASRAVEQIRAAASETMKELRSTVRLLRTPHQDDLRSTVGLSGVGRLAEAARETGLDVDLAMSVAPGELSTTIDAAAYRIIQESVTNVLRHSGASAVKIGAAVDNGILTLEVTDNGIAAAGGTSNQPSNGHGIIGMRERAASLGGYVSTMGPSRDGFSVRAQLPAKLDP